MSPACCTAVYKSVCRHTTSRYSLFSPPRVIRADPTDTDAFRGCCNTANKKNTRRLNTNDNEPNQGVGYIAGECSWH